MYSIDRTRLRRLSFFVRSSIRTEQSLQSAAKIRCLADVGFGLCIVAAQREHRRRGWYCGKDLRIAFRREFQALGQHKAILAGNQGNPRKRRRGSALIRGDDPDPWRRTYLKLALRNFCRKSSPSILMMRHISCRRERMRSPIRSPRLSARAAARTADPPFAPPAG